MKSHPHKALILQWVEGAEIEARNPPNGAWVPATKPAWDEHTEYRVKPAAPVVETKMTDAELIGNIYEDCGGYVKQLLGAELNRARVNQGIARAIADGQVVTKEDHEEAVVRLGDRLKGIAIKASEEERAARDMAVAQAVKTRCLEVLRMMRTSAHSVGFGSPDFQISGIDLSAIIAKVGMK